MSKTPSRRMFLERRTYRRNRLQDAARLLPLFGAGLFFAPVFIRGDGADATGLSDWLVYFFVIWLGLIVLAMQLGRALDTDGERPGQSSAREAERGEP